MPYVIRKSNGSILLTVSDGVNDYSTSQVNGDTGLNLVGRSYTNYGQLVAENFVHLLENFANDTAPDNPLEGQIWYDTDNSEPKFWRINPTTQIGSWSSLTSIGATGPVGPTGAQGPTGPAAPTVGTDTVPATSLGNPGDDTGMTAADTSYFYVCTGTYDSSTDIWKRIAWTDVLW
jgi:hypothetical protein